MGIQTVQAFFMWCTILNGGLLIFYFVVFVRAGDLLYRLHNRWFQMPRETFNVILYAILGVYKIFFLLFNLAPFVALILIG